jgi:hypothetical protein
MTCSFCNLLHIECCTITNLNFLTLIDCVLFYVTLKNLFTCMETSPFPMMGCKIYAHARLSEPLSREGSLSCHTCCGSGPPFFRSLPKDRPIQSPLTTQKECGGSILTRILTDPIQSPLTTRKGVLRTYFYPYPNRSVLGWYSIGWGWCRIESFIRGEFNGSCFTQLVHCLREVNNKATNLGVFICRLCCILLLDLQFTSFSSAMHIEIRYRCSTF